MKTIIMATVSVLLCSTAWAQESEQMPTTREQDFIQRESTCPECSEKPEYIYAEIIGNHLPQTRPDGVLFDFGQKTDKWAYNWLPDEQGEKCRFNSAVAALNHMIGKGWEFVTVYTSGENSGNVHYLLRIQVSQLTAVQRQLLDGK